MTSATSTRSASSPPGTGQAPPSATSEGVGIPRPTDLSRLLEVTLVLVRNGLVTAGSRSGALARQPHRQAPRTLAVALRRAFCELGPTYVKFGQLVASTPGLFPPFLAAELRRLLDGVPPEEPGVVRRVIERELGRGIDELFASFDDAPVAAASVAQVHRAVLHDGTVVAVKVRRPDLRRRVEQDLRLLRALALVVEHAGAVGQVLNPVAVIDDLAATVRSELDFRREAESMCQFATILRASGHVDRCVVPRPIDDMVAERVLVMTHVDGIPIDDVDTLRAQGHDLEQLLRAGIRAWVAAALGHGLFHGDVHAGNLFVTPAGKVAFLDFGIVGRLDEPIRLVLRHTLPSVLLDGDFGSVVRAVFELGAATGEVDMEQATADVRQLLEPIAAKPLSEISYGEVLGHILQVATRYHVVLPRELVLVAKQLLYFERYGKRLAPDYAILSDPDIVADLLGPPASPAGTESGEGIATGTSETSLGGHGRRST